MNNMANSMMSTPTHRQRTQTIRDALEAFVNERLQEKLKRLRPEQWQQHEALKEAHQLEHWLADAVRRAKRIRLASHTLKPIHPDAQGTNLYVTATRNTPGLVGTHGLRKRRSVDAVGDSDSMDIAMLLTQVEYDGRPLLDWIQANEPAVRAALSDDPERAQSRCDALAAIMGSKFARPTSHSMAKQLFFPLDNGGYHLLAPLFPTTLVHRAHQDIHESYLGSTSAEARKAHRENRPSSNGYSDYPDLVVRHLGGDKSRHASLLNRERCGENWLLPSLPPSGVRTPSHVVVANSESIFDKQLAEYEPIQSLIAEFQQLLLTHPFNSLKATSERRRLVREIGEEIIQYAARLRAQPAGWTANAPCRLNEHEVAWLDPPASRATFPSGDNSPVWPTEVSQRLANWLAQTLNSNPSPYAKPKGDVRARALCRDLQRFTEFLSSAYD